MLQSRLITKGQEVPDFLNSMKPSVMVRSTPWPKSPSTSTSDCLKNMYVLLYCTKVCVKFPAVLAVGCLLGLCISALLPLLTPINN